MTWIFSVGAVAYYIGIGLAVVFHFRSSFRPPRFLALTAATALNLAACLYFVHATDDLHIGLLVGICLVAVAGVLFAWALMVSRQARLKLIFDPADPHQLLEQGPYKYIRHPFYASYCLFWIGCAVATLHPTNIIFAAIIVTVFAHAARSEEQSFETTSLAEAYQAYRQRAGFFWPKW